MDKIFPAKLVPIASSQYKGTLFNFVWSFSYHWRLNRACCFLSINLLCQDGSLFLIKGFNGIDF